MMSPSHGYHNLPKTGTGRGNCDSGFGTFSSVAFRESHGIFGPADQLAVLIELLGQMSNDPTFLCELIFGFGWQNGANKNSLPPL